MRHIIKLSDDVVPDFWAPETVRLVDLRAKMAEDNDGRLVFTYKDRTNKEFKVFNRLSVTVSDRRHEPYATWSHQKTHAESSTSNSSMTKSVKSGM
jgi:hypothetical protein